MHKCVSLSIVSFLIVGGNLIGQNWSAGSITGEGEVVKKEITLEAIDGVNLGFNGNVVLTPGNMQKIVIEGQQNIIDNIKKEVKGGTWDIYFVKKVKEAKPVTVYITLPTVEELDLSGSGSLRSTAKFTGINEIEIAVSGSGEITFDYEANETEVNLSGSGKINLSGASKMIEINISGSGDVFAEQLTATEGEINISGSGDARVKVNGELETSISGSGDVRYTGNASVRSSISGSGTVSKL
jgi:Putative auto-transporter adhesin, head GIN domain